MSKKRNCKWTENKNVAKIIKKDKAISTSGLLHYLDKQVRDFVTPESGVEETSVPIKFDELPHSTVESSIYNSEIDESLSIYSKSESDTESIILSDSERKRTQNIVTEKFVVNWKSLCMLLRKCTICNKNTHIRKALRQYLKVCSVFQNYDTFWELQPTLKNELW